MQQLRPLSSGITALVTIFALSLAPACKDDKPTDGGEGKTDPKPAADTGAAASAGATEPAGSGGPSATSGGGAESGPGEAGAGEAGAAEAGAAEAGAGEAGAGEAGAAAGETGAAEDVVPGLFEQAKSLDTGDDEAKKALADAIAAGATKIDAAKIANERGEALMADGEGERAAVFFQWAADTHKLYADPIYNLATLAAYAGDLDIAKEHLQELQKRGNKKLMKKVGVDPAFALLVDDPEVRKIYEQ